MRIWISSFSTGLPSSVSIAAVSLLAVVGIGAFCAGTVFAFPYGQQPPTGHYGCISAPVDMAHGPGYGDTIYKNRIAEGDMWINSDYEYAGPNDKENRGTYVMDGMTLIPRTGAFAPPGPRTRITFIPAQGKFKASLYIVYLDDKGQASRASECFWSDPLQ